VEAKIMTPGTARASRAQLRAPAKLPKMNSFYFLFGEAPQKAREGACAPQT
jgi:hypothetical protein